MMTTDVLGVLVSAGLFAFIRHSSYAPQLKADVGVLFMVLNAIAVALVNSQARTVTIFTMGGHVSWVTIVILVGSMMLPTTPRKMLAAALFSASMDRTFYYVMELLSGRDLDSLVREFGPVPADRTLFLLSQVCHSLADAHARGLVHRDVTPANIYACRMGLEYDFVKVLDFGLVKFNDPSAMQTTLMTGPHVTTARRRSWRPRSSPTRERSTSAPTSTRSAASPTTC
jgi:serine/threonine protein kinase